MVAHLLPKQRVAGSNPVSRSNGECRDGANGRRFHFIAFRHSIVLLDTFSQLHRDRGTVTLCHFASRDLLSCLWVG
jgi:hypothetical protein